MDYPIVVYVDDFYSLGNDNELRMRIVKQINESLSSLILESSNFSLECASLETEKLGQSRSTKDPTLPTFWIVSG